MSIPRITNALKTSGKARKSMSTPLNAFSNEMKLNSLEAAFFDKMAKDGEVALVQPRGVTLSTWEDLEDQKSKPLRLSSDHPPRPAKQLKIGENKRSR